jgi:ATP-binding cassette, subfamily B, multidrug efflux pump
VSTGGAAHEEDSLGKAYDGRLMGRLLTYLRPYRWRVAGAVAMLLAGAAVEVVGPLLTRYALDRAIPESDFALLGVLAALYLGALLAGFIFEAAQTLLTTSLGQHVMYDLRLELFAHLQRLPLPFYDRTPVGRSMTRVTSDVESMNELFGSGVVAAIGDIFTLVFILTAMFLLDWRLALVTLTVMPLVVGAAAVFRSRIRASYRDIRTRLARINAFLQERLSGMAVVQLFGREERTARRFRAENDDYLRAHLRSIRYYALFFPIIELLTAVALSLVIVYGGGRVLEGTLTVGVVAAFLQWARRFFRPIQDLSEKYNMLQGTLASSERIFRLLDTEAGVAESQGAPAASGAAVPGGGVAAAAAGRIEFRDVWFAYQTVDGEPAEAAAADAQLEWVLRGISFEARPGERLAVVGHTGAGKTSLISLLMRFYQPQRGEILFDGVPIRDIPVFELRERMGLVLQDVFLFSRDVRYNIRLGRKEIAESAVRAAAERVGASRFIDRLPHGYDEPVGERGTTLSTGERQLLSFARALAFDPLVLILDEATSSVDSALEAQIDAALQELMQGRTSLVIAHRLSTVRSADRILVLHHGELLEEGRHEELLARSGLYAQLHELQFAGAGRQDAGAAAPDQALLPAPLESEEDMPHGAEIAPSGPAGGVPRSGSGKP